jgi:hypothetical protein
MAKTVFRRSSSSREGSRVRARHVLGPGDRAYCALSWAEGLAAPQNVDEAEARIAATIRYWRGSSLLDARRTVDGKTTDQFVEAKVAAAAPR